MQMMLFSFTAAIILKLIQFFKFIHAQISSIIIIFSNNLINNSYATEMAQFHALQLRVIVFIVLSINLLEALAALAALYTICCQQLNFTKEQVQLFLVL